jgi:class 3 adenylate cyclase
MDLDLEALGLTEIIRLQNRLSELLRRKFTKTLGLCFTDIVGSTAYFTRFGDEAGRRLQQRHFDLLERALAPERGRVVDTAGDGAFSVFPTIEAGAVALIAFYRLLADDNAARGRDEELVVRAGLHWGEVLTDGEHFSGEAVNLCARVAATGGESEIRLTIAAFRELPKAQKERCFPLPPMPLKGIPGVVEIEVLPFRDRSLFPVSVRVVETGKVIPLPYADVITFGRVRDDGGGVSGDVILEAPDPATTHKISRFHFELRRKSDGFVLRSTSDRMTEVDGTAVPKGGETRVGRDSIVRISRALTLVFVGPPDADAPGLSTLETMQETLPR